MAKAMGVLGDFEGSPSWELYLRGSEAQVAIERRLFEELAAKEGGRDRVLARWMCSPPRPR